MISTEPAYNLIHFYGWVMPPQAGRTRFVYLAKVANKAARERFSWNVLLPISIRKLVQQNPAESSRKIVSSCNTDILCYGPQNVS